MKLLDVNLALPWHTLTAFVRLSTRAAIMTDPLSPTTRSTM